MMSAVSDAAALPTCLTEPADAASPDPKDGDRARGGVLRQALTSERSTYCRMPPLR